MKDKIREELKKRASLYTTNELGRFIAEVGWQDWMEEYSANEEPTDREVEKINELLTEIFWEVNEDKL